MSATPQGYFSFVLHSHIPYVRLAGRWPHGEEMIHEVLSETYIPLLEALYDLKAAGITPHLSIGLTPILLEQLADPDVLLHFEAYAQERLELANGDVARFTDEGDTRRATIARFYAAWYQRILTAFIDRFDRDVVGAFRRLQGAGDIDVLTSAATHGYLPLLRRDSTIAAQLAIGMRTSRRHLAKVPHGVWLPECAYRPAYLDGDARFRRAGIEEHLADFNLGYFFTETHVVQGGKLIGKAAGDALGLYGAVPERELAPADAELPFATERTALRPYYVQASRVAVLARDGRTGMQVWSASEGYPGDFAYREFHKKDDVSGLQYWRVTDPSGDLGGKDYYDPEAAQLRVLAHARHFAGLVAELAQTPTPDGRPPLIVSAYDTELFGHWWFEGIDWIREVLRLLADSPVVAATTVDDYLQAYPPSVALSIPESSWGAGGTHWTWSNPQTAWMWPLIHAAESRMEGLAKVHAGAEGAMVDVLNQAAREFLLLTASDWPFLVTTKQARDYATSRFQQHLARFNRLCAIADSGQLSAEAHRFLTAVTDADNPFPDIDYREFAARGQP